MKVTVTNKEKPPKIEKEETKSKKNPKHVGMSNTSAPAMSLENPGIDPGTSRMLSGRSTI